MATQSNQEYSNPGGGGGGGGGASFTYYDEGPEAGPTLAIDLDNGNLQDFTLTGNITTFSFSNLATNDISVSLRVEQGGSGGYTISGYDASIKFPGGGEPVLSTGVGDIDVLQFIVMDSVAYFTNIVNDLT